MENIMKQLFYILVLFALPFVSFSQKSDLNSFELKNNPINFKNINTTGNQILDFQNISPIFTQSGNSQILATNDTLNQFVKNSTGFTSYAVTIQGNTYPLTGWNPYYFFLGQKFNISGTAKVSEILFAASGKALLGSNIDSIRGFVFAGEATQGLPTSNLGGGWIMFNQIDTNSKVPVYSSIKFQDPVSVDTKFVTMLLTFNNTNEYDAVILYSNMQGDGKNQKNLCMVFNNNGSLSAINYTDFWGQVGLKMQDGNPPDYDALIFPIIQTGNSVTENLTINGLTINSISPNPASDFADFNLILDETTNISIDLVNVTGQTVLTFSKENCASGEHHFNLDLSNISSGSYYYLIRTNSTKFGGKLNIVK